MKIEMDDLNIPEKAKAYINHIRWLCRIMDKEVEEMHNFQPLCERQEFWESELKSIADTVQRLSYDLITSTGYLIKEIDADLETRNREIMRKKKRDISYKKSARINYAELREEAEKAEPKSPTSYYDRYKPTSGKEEQEAEQQ